MMIMFDVNEFDVMDEILMGAEAITSRMSSLPRRDDDKLGSCSSD